ncbi:hypothetical protein IJM86_04115 [bacterium]|nr:hypothetical protein [bacterium]
MNKPINQNKKARIKKTIPNGAVTTKSTQTIHKIANIRETTPQPFDFFSSVEDSHASSFLFVSLEASIEVDKLLSSNLGWKVVSTGCKLC